MRTYANGAKLDLADAHLAAVDPVMAGLIKRFGPVDEDLHVPTSDLYGALILVSVIIGPVIHTLLTNLIWSNTRLGEHRIE